MRNAEWKRDRRARRASIHSAFRIPHSALEVSMPSPLVECVPNFSEAQNAGTMDAGVAPAGRRAERAAAWLQVPSYLYAKAATRPERERLPDIRKGEFEALRERIGRDPVADPDVGPKRIHPTAGATAIGARP